jgi:D-glycero-D-manno-heptose 1,7-bisphosphate phosphatase
MERRAVFFDRDGVLNHVVFREGRAVSPRTMAQLIVVDGAPAAMLRLKCAGLHVFGVTNQPDVARGFVTAALADDMTRTVALAARLDDYRICPHDDPDDCGCRKPRPGMITGLAEAWSISLDRSFVVGDSDRDVGAGRAAGCTTVLLRRPYNERVHADIVVDSVAEAAVAILERAQ